MRNKIRRTLNTLSLVAPAIGLGLFACWAVWPYETLVYMAALLAMICILVIRLQQLGWQSTQEALDSAYERERVRGELDRQRTEKTLAEIEKLGATARAAIRDES